MDELQHKAQVVAQVLRRYSVDAQVIPGESFQTSGMNVLSILPGASTKVTAVTKLADELDDVLTRAVGRSVSVRFETKPLRVLVPRERPQVADMLDVLGTVQRQLRNRRGLFALVGEAIGVRSAELCATNLAGSNAPHWLLAGMTGSGKTTALIGMVASMALLNTPERLTMWVLDPKNELGFLRGLPCVGRVVSDAQSCVKALGDAVREMDRRSRHSIIDPSHRYVVVIDELADLIDVAGSDAELLLKRILQKGRGHGIHVIAATQHALAENIGSTAKANFSVRLAFRTPNAEASKVATGMAALGAERLPGCGAAIKVGARGVESVQAYNISRERVAALGGAPVQQRERTFSGVGVPQTAQTAVETAYQTAPVPLQTAVETAVETAETGTDKLPYRMPNRKEARIIRAFYDTLGSKNAVIRELWPNRNKATCLQYIDAALTRQEVAP